MFNFLVKKVEEDGAGERAGGEGPGAGHGGAQDQEDTAHDCIKVGREGSDHL